MKKLILMLLATVLLTACTPYVHYDNSYPTPQYSCVVYYPSGVSSCMYYGMWRMNTVWGNNQYYRPPVIIRTPTGGQNGRVINGRGYTRGTQYKESAGRSQGNRTAVPRQATPRPQTRAAPPPPPERRVKPTPPVRRRGGGS